MGSYQNIILSKSNTSVVGQHESDTVTTNNGQKKVEIMAKKEGFIGVLDVFVHQARNIQNICIYHKQDVYAKIFLTNNPEATESTRVINGAGQNPVFDQNLRINVQNGDCSLKCEIWMLSRIRNYLQDQLLGFATVPLCEILVESTGKLEKEFILSTSELFESPCGFVKLSIIYTGTQPDVLEITSPNGSRNPNLDKCDEVSSELEKIEFTDPKIMKENEIMVSEYYSNTEIESPSVIDSQTTENDDSDSSNFGDLIVSRASKENLEIISVTNDESSESDKYEESEKIEEKSQSSVDSNKTEAEEKVLQQDFVDIYLKSMKQFTEALEKMNFPMKTGKESPDSGVNDCVESNPNGKKSTGEGPCPKVFYGSRAFF